MKPNFQDLLNLYMDKDIIKIIGNETIYYSNKIYKINAFSIKKERSLVLTDLSLYNIKNKKVKRKMKYEEMLGITFSTFNNEFVVHANKGYDFYFLSHDKTIIIYIIAKCYEKIVHKHIILCQVKDKSLKPYVTTKKQKKKDSHHSELDEKNRIDTLTFIIDNDPVETSKRSLKDLVGGAKNPNFPVIQEEPKKINSKIIFSNDNKIKDIGFEDFNIVTIIGRGISGKALLVENQFNKENYVLKNIEKKYFDIDDSKLQKIKQFTKNLVFPFLINIDFCFETDDRIYFAFPYIQGEDLFYNIYKNEKFDEEKIRFYSGIIGLTLDYLDKNGVKYKSFSSKNILIDKDGYLKLVPFHIGTIFKIKNDDKNKYKNIVENYKNEYSPPEVFIDDTQKNKCAYWWNLGVLIFEMIYNIPPFFTDIDAEMKNVITNNELKFPNIPQISENLKDLINKLLNKKCEERLGYQNGFDDIKKHIFFKDYNFEELLGKTKEAPYKPTMTVMLETNKKMEEKFTYKDLKKYGIFIKE